MFSPRVTRAASISFAMLALAAVFACAGAASDRASSTVRVTLGDFEIRLSTGTVPPGRVAFRVLNRGNVAHDFDVDGKRTKPLAHGQRQTLTVDLANVGTYRFLSDLPGQAQLGMTGRLEVRRASFEPKRSIAVSTRSTITLTPVVTGLPPLTFAVSPPGDPDRLLIVEQSGLVLLLEDGHLASEPFADLRSVVDDNGEQGLLSLAFAPDYTTSGLLYAYYNNKNGNIRVVELHRSDTDPDEIDSSRRRILAITKTTADHNGGMMQFGPDGDLYVAIGDGGADPPTVPVGITGQTLNDLFGSIIRIDPRSGNPYSIPSGNPFAATPGDDPEIVAYGLRNPWRFWIDPPTNEMVIGDVGEGSREEIDVLPLDHLGLDFGWPCKEGDVVPPNVTIPASCQSATLTPPVYDYPHSATRCAIVGGVVDRDPATKGLDGLYLWSDLCSHEIYALTQQDGKAAVLPLGVGVTQPSSFGTDGSGRVYVVTGTGGVYRLGIAPASSKATGN
jgi:glucose/arabinose dehydrogenase